MVVRDAVRAADLADRHQAVLVRGQIEKEAQRVIGKLRELHDGLLKM
jgi:hypothetical protein